MNPPIKKFATIFLLVAVVTSSLAWGASSFLINRGMDEAAVSGQGGGPGRAFRAPSAADGIYGAGPNGQNLTAEVANIYARELVRANPQGPEVGEDGTISLLNPTTENLRSFLENNPPPEDILTRFDESRVQVLQSFTAGDVSRYISDVSQIQGRIAENPAWQEGAAIVSGSPEESEWIVSSQKALVNARDELYALRVPAPLAEFHRALLALFSTTASFSQIAARDPGGAIVLSGKLGDIISKQNEEVVKAANELVGQSLGAIPASSQERLSLGARLLGVQVAQATLVEDIAHWAITTASWAKDFAFQYKEIALSIALGYLKSTLLQELSNKVLAWAEGEGVPGYVTNWLVLEVNAGKRAAERYIASRSRSLCGNAATGGVYGSIIASALGSPAAEDAGVPDTIGDALNCPQNRRGGFNTDGTYNWTGYLNSLVHNPVNDILSLRDGAVRTSAAAAEAAVNEARAGGGFTDSKKCDDGSSAGPGGSCDDGTPAQTVTLGSSKQDLSSKSLSSIFDLITATNNENMMTTLATAVANSVLVFALQEGTGVFGGGASGDWTPPPPSDDISVQLRNYDDVLTTALNNTNGAKSAIQNAIQITENAIQACDESSIGQAQALLEGFRGLLPPIESRLQNIQGLLNTVRQFQQNPSEHTLSELEARVGDFDSVIAIANRALEDNSLAEDAAVTANEFIQSCSI